MDSLLQCPLDVNVQCPLLGLQCRPALSVVVCVAGGQLGDEHHNGAKGVQTGGDEQSPPDDHDAMFVEDEEEEDGHGTQGDLNGCGPKFVGIGSSEAVPSCLPGDVPMVSHR